MLAPYYIGLFHLIHDLSCPSISIIFFIVPLGPGQTDRDGYNLSENPRCIPNELLQARIEAIFVEFLRVSSTGAPVTRANLAKNHVVYKIDFVDKPLDFEGARLAMDVDADTEYSSGSDGGEPRYKPGRLNVKPVPFKRTSDSSARTFQLLIARDLTLGSLLYSLVSRRLQLFDFANIGDRFFGCRDFMAQTFLLFESEGYIGRNIIWSHSDNPPTPSPSVIDALGLRWADGRIEASPIDMGRFDDHIRVESPDVPYSGSQRSRELAQVVRRM